MQLFFNELLDLPQTEVTGYKIDGNKIYLEVQSTFDEVPCRQCGKKTKSKGYAEKREIRHLSMNDKVIWQQFRGQYFIKGFFSLQTQ